MITADQMMSAMLEQSEDVQNVLTPFALCEEIINNIPNVADNKSIIVIANAEFVMTLVKKFNVSANNITFITVCQLKYHMIKQIAPGVNILYHNSYTDFLRATINMKFDVIIGNPPYQDGNSTLQSSKIYPKIFSKCFDDLLVDDGYLAFITPTAWQSAYNSLNTRSRNKDMDRMKYVMRYYNLIFLALEYTQAYFNVGSTFSSYIIQKNLTKSGTLLFDDHEIVNFDAMDILPKKMNKISLAIFEKMQNFQTKMPLIEGGSFATQGFHSSPINKDSPKPNKTKTDQFCHQLFHTNAQFLYSDKIHPLHKDKKVIGSLSGYFKPKYDPGTCGITEAAVAIVVKSDIEAQIVINILNSNLFKFMLDQSKFTGFTNQYALKKIGWLNTDRAWTDEEIYAHFGLTQDEIDYIENYITK